MVNLPIKFLNQEILFILLHHIFIHFIHYNELKFHQDQILKFFSSLKFNQNNYIFNFNLLNLQFF